MFISFTPLMPLSYESFSNDVCLTPIPISIQDPERMLSLPGIMSELPPNITWTKNIYFPDIFLLHILLIWVMSLFFLIDCLFVFGGGVIGYICIKRISGLEDCHHDFIGLRHSQCCLWFYTKHRSDITIDREIQEARQVLVLINKLIKWMQGNCIQLIMLIYHTSIDTSIV